MFFRIHPIAWFQRVVICRLVIAHQQVPVNSYLNIQRTQIPHILIYMEMLVQHLTNG